VPNVTAASDAPSSAQAASTAAKQRVERSECDEDEDPILMITD
jgi:hypothetical protein